MKIRVRFGLSLVSSIPVWAFWREIYAHERTRPKYPRWIQQTRRCAWYAFQEQLDQIDPLLKLG